MKNKNLLKKYASLIAKTGANIQKGQEVVIRASINAYEFIVLLVEACYKRGAKKVSIKWSDDELTKLHYKFQKEETLSHLTSYDEEEYRYSIKNLPVLIYIESDAPDALKDINPKKMSECSKTLRSEIRKFRDQMDGKYQWVIAGYPSLEWAKEVHPELKPKDAYNKLLEEILYVSRVTKDTDPNKNWDEHDKNLTERSNKLNSLKLKKLIYKSNNGTDFSLELNPEVKWEGGGEYTAGKKKVYFNPNIPSEEIFTTPIKGKAEGIVYSSKPLSFNGNLIEDFSIRFENGKAVEWHAKKGEDILKSIIEADETSCYLGECALIGYHSPISLLNTVFLNTLYDENASCHLALGMGFSNLYPEYEKYSLEELAEKGINKSNIHVDFMIGTKDMSIKGIDIFGNEHIIFKDGDWAL